MQQSFARRTQRQLDTLSSQRALLVCKCTMLRSALPRGKWAISKSAQGIQTRQWLLQSRTSGASLVVRFGPLYGVVARSIANMCFRGHTQTLSNPMVTQSRVFTIQKLPFCLARRARQPQHLHRFLLDLSLLSYHQPRTPPFQRKTYHLHHRRLQNNLLRKLHHLLPPLLQLSQLHHLHRKSLGGSEDFSSICVPSALSRMRVGCGFRFDPTTFMTSSPSTFHLARTRCSTLKKGSFAVDFLMQQSLQIAQLRETRALK